MKIGDVIKVAVTEVENYGAYVATSDHKIGFIDWFEFSWMEYRCDPKMPQEVLEIGQLIDVKFTVSALMENFPPPSND